MKPPKFKHPTCKHGLNRRLEPEIVNHMKRFLIGAVLTGVLLACNTITVAQQFKDSPAQKLFDDATGYLEDQYFGIKEINWKQLFDQYQTQVDAVCAVQKELCPYSTVEPVLVKMFADFKDGHVFYLPAPTVQSISQLNQGNLTSNTRRLGYVAVRFCDTPTGECSANQAGQIVERQLPEQFVRHVVANSPAAKGGLRYGDRVIGFDSVMYKDATSNAELNQMAGEFARRVQAGEPMTLRLQRGANRQLLELNMTGAIIQEAEVPQLEIRDDQIAVLTIRTFYIKGIAERVHQLLQTAMQQNVRGLVINLRGTSGGFATESLAIIAAFIEKPESLRYVPRYEAAQNVIELRHQDGQVVITVNNNVVERLSVSQPVLFKAPVAVLVDNLCASACEYVPLFMQRAKRALVYGIPTNGVANTNTQGFQLQNGGVASMPTVQTFWVNGLTRLPDRAQPDTVTPNYEFEHFMTGRDVPLEKAIEGLK
jgi:carboxyl-terminal processing protease